HVAVLTGSATSEPSALSLHDALPIFGPEGPSVLKVMPPGHRTVDQVRAEVDWLLALIGEHITVSEPIRSRTGEWVEELPSTGHLVIAYRQAPGECRVWDPDLPPGRQSPPGSCDDLERQVPAGNYLVYG